MTDEEEKAYYAKRTMTVAVNDAMMEHSIYDKPKHTKVRSTSRKVFNEEIKPKLGEKQQQVYVAIQMSKRPVNNQELADYLKMPINSITPRTNELVEMGKVKKAFIDVYPKTGRKTVYWTVNEIL